MKSQTIIFIGRSGCGKGTQADLVEKYLREDDPEKREILHIVTGNFLRELAKGDSYSSEIIRDILSKGLLVPDFLPVSMWGKYFIDNVKGHEHIVTDGMPRKLHEAIMLDGAFRFYKRDKPIVVFIDLSYDSAVKRLLARKRADDTKEAIEERLKFYDADVMPVIDYYRNSPEHVFLHIDGEPNVETINKNVMNLLEEIW